MADFDLMAVAVGVVVLQTAACLGLGAVCLRLLGVLGDASMAERGTWAFAVGFGILGWILYFVGIAGGFHDFILWIVLAGSALGCVFLFVTPGLPDHPAPAPIAAVEILLASAIGVSILFDLAEGLSPAADADTLAYHFDLPRQFIAAAQIEFVPRVADGAIPLLVQMTYVPALALGGETSLTLWTMLSGWGAAGLLYELSRRFLDRAWSLALVLLFLTTPATVGFSGTGHVEVRNAMFVIIAVISISTAGRTGLFRHTVLAGLAVGFFMGAKLTGLLFAAACGLAVLGQRRRFAHGTVLSLVAIAAGGQWYFWNWLHTGDPVFPLLFEWLEPKDGAVWDMAHHVFLRNVLFAGERAIPVNVANFLYYPILATFGGPALFDSGRTGLGPLAVILLPFSLAAAWRFRDRLAGHPLFAPGVIVILFYALWFFTGSTQRIRQLLPIYPIVALILLASAERWSRQAGVIVPLIVALAVVSSIQLAGQTVFALNHLRLALGNETRAAFLARNIGGFEAVRWINENLADSDRLYSTDRQLNFLFEKPFYYAHHGTEALIDLRPSVDDPRRFHSQLKKLNITHLLVSDQGDRGTVTGRFQWRKLRVMGCLEHLKTFEFPVISSRTMPTLNSGENRRAVYWLKSAACLAPQP